MFSNRQQAGILLAQKLTQLIKHSEQVDVTKTVVLALPRGGLPVALEIASALHCPLNIITSKKIGAPDQPELAIGAVTSDGLVVIDKALSSYLNISPAYLESKIEYLVTQTKSLEETWRKAAGMEISLDVRHKRVIVVDDGVATGMTAIAAARSLRQHDVAQLILATPVASQSAFNSLQKEYDQVVVLDMPVDFRAVGQFYTDFHQVQDVEVVEALKQMRNNSQLNLA